MLCRRIVLTLCLLAVLLGVAAADRYAGWTPLGDDWARYHGRSFEVSRVIDGDTLELHAPDGDRRVTTVRLWGINTPEIAKPQWNTPDQPWSREAKAFAGSLAEGATVTLQLQRHRYRGRYGRVLAYVVLADGSVLNERLLAGGYAEQEDRWSHDQVRAYDELERQARREAVGMWSK